MILVGALQCSVCNDIIYSRAGHDFRECSCGSCFVDGGREYFRGGFDPEYDEPKSLKIKINTTQQKLFNDWNYGNDKYGLIKKGKKDETWDWDTDGKQTATSI